MADDRDESIIRALPGLARIAGAAWWRPAEWTVGTSLRTPSRVMRAAATGEPPADLFQSAGSDVRDYLRTLLGDVDEGEEQDDRANASASEMDSDASAQALRRRGAHLLSLSADVTFD